MEKIFSAFSCLFFLSIFSLLFLPCTRTLSRFFLGLWWQWTAKVLMQRDIKEKRSLLSLSHAHRPAPNLHLLILSSGWLGGWTKKKRLTEVIFSDSQSSGEEGIPFLLFSFPLASCDVCGTWDESTLRTNTHVQENEARQHYTYATAVSHPIKLLGVELHRGRTERDSLELHSVRVVWM